MRYTTKVLVLVRTGLSGRTGLRGRRVSFAGHLHGGIRCRFASVANMRRFSGYYGPDDSLGFPLWGLIAMHAVLAGCAWRRCKVQLALDCSDGRENSGRKGRRGAWPEEC